MFTSELSALTLSKDATFYSDSFEGGNTSNNEIFHQDGFTAAVCDIALGKNIYVSSENTGTLIHINDRPNCNRYPNILDLTRTAFTLFAPASVGRIPSLQIDTLDSIDSHIFTSLGVELDSGTPSVYFAGDGIEINGRVLDKKKKVIVYLKNSTTLEEDSPSYLFSTSKNGTFSAHFMLP